MMLAFYFCLLIYINWIQFLFGDSSHLDYNIIYDENAIGGQKESASSAATPLSLNWWKWKVTTSTFAQQFVNDMITGTREVIHKKFDEKRDTFIQKLPISDILRAKIKTAINLYIYPAVDTMFVSAMVSGYKFAQKELADEYHIDTKYVPTFTYSDPKKMSFYHSSGLLHKSYSISPMMKYGLSAPTFTDQVMFKYLYHPVPDIPKTPSRIKTISYKIGMHQARKEFNVKLKEEQHELRTQIEQTTPKLHERFPVYMKTMDDSAVNALHKYANLCFDLLEEGMETKLKMDQQKAIKAAHAQYRNRYDTKRLLRYKMHHH